MPEWITFNPRDEEGNFTDTWWVIYTDDIELINMEYEILLTTKMFDYYNDTTVVPTQDQLQIEGFEVEERTTSWILKMTYFEVIIPNIPPVFTRPIMRNIDIYLGAEMTFTTGPVIDDAIDENFRASVTVEWEDDLLSDFLDYSVNEETSELTLTLNPTLEE